MFLHLSICVSIYPHIVYKKALNVRDFTVFSETEREKHSKLNLTVTTVSSKSKKKENGTKQSLCLHSIPSRYTRLKTLFFVSGFLKEKEKMTNLVLGHM